MEIMEVFDDVKKSVGDKGFYLLIGAGALFFLYNLSKDSGGSGDTLVEVNSTASYPDAVTNADVIIATLQNSIEYSDNEMKEYLEENFTATNDYINKGLESQQKLMEENFDSVYGSIDDLQTNQSTINKNISAIKTDVSGIKSNVSSIKTDVSGIKSNVSDIKTQVKDVKSEIKDSKKNTNVLTKNGYYVYKTAKGYNTTTSFYDALLVIGVDNSLANRKKIAEKNGIKNYTGKYSQNIKLLSLLKQGKLKAV